MLEGIDYSHARPGGAKIAAAGKHFVVRYLYPNPDGTGKGLTHAEVKDLQAHSLGIALVYEGAAGDMKKGHSQGLADAKLAQAQLAGLTGLPRDLPIYFAKDYAGGLGAAEIAYLAAAASVIGLDRTGLYGGWDAIDDAITGKHATWFWQTYAWSSGKVRAGIHLFQYSNGQWSGQVDYVRALQPQYGQKPPASPPPPAPTPAGSTNATPTPEEESGMYIQAAGHAPIYWFNRAAGTKRHITPTEWTVAHLTESGEHVTVLALAAADVAAIPTAS